jgi:KDO2-lipid IV(A) lauroyltransferase
VLLYYVFGYRKKVILKNLNLAFPEKSTEEKHKITKAFYRHFTDIIVESIKAFTISEKEMLKRYKYSNPELINKYANEGRSIALVGAHLANWEWSCSMPLVTDIKCFGAYTTLNNKYFEKAIRNTRERFGFTGYKTSETVQKLKKNIENDVQGLYLLLSDQSPELRKTFYWNSFFNVKVPIHTGAEMLSKKFDFVVINYVVTKIKRGFFEVDFQLITDNPKQYKNYEITDLYTKITEENIRKQPEYYLWSHNRFKHKNRFKEWQERYESKQQTKS